MDTWMSQHLMCTNTRVSAAPQQAWAGGEGESLAKKQEEDPDLWSSLAHSANPLLIPQSTLQLKGHFG